MSRLKVENRWVISHAELRSFRGRQAELEDYHEARLAGEMLREASRQGIWIRPSTMMVDKTHIAMAPRQVLIHEPDTLLIRVVAEGESYADRKAEVLGKADDPKDGVPA